MSRLHRALLPALALLAATACTGDGGDGGEGERGASEPPRLKRAWTVPAPDAKPASSYDTYWLAQGVLAMRTGTEGDRLTGYTTGSGEERWNLPLPKGTTGVCELSKQVNGKGIGGILLDAGDGDERCSVAAAVDVKRGRVLWTEPLERASETMGAGHKALVSVGDKALTVTVGLSDVVRYRLEGDGGEGGEGGRKRRLPGLPHFPDLPIGGGNVDPVDHDGQHIAVQVGDRFALYDADKGTRLWHTSVESQEPHLEGLVSTDPVVLDATVNNRRFYRAYGPKGTEKRLGKELIDSDQYVPLTARGMLVLKARNDRRASAYDMRTGERAWTRKLPEGEEPAGVRGGTLLASRRYSGKETVLLSRDPRSGAPRTLGRLNGQAAEARILAWDERRLYLRGADRNGAEKLTAYALP